jgi:secreted PhoX family phosphatase
MKKNLNSILCSVGVLLFASSNSDAQITLKQDYVNKKSATIGTFQGISFREAGFSGLYSIPHTNGKEFWTVSDRGVNVDAANANPSTCRPTYDKIYGFATYAPKIHRIKLNGDSIQILQTISIKRPNGTTATGLLNPTGFGSTALEMPSIDTVLNCANFAAKQVAKDAWGIDSEGILVDKDGNFWLCEEGGPTIWKLSPNGVVMKRFTPYATMPGAEPQDIAIDTVFKYRKNNRGFEGIAMTPSGKIYAIIQSPILFPNKTVGEGTMVHRIVEIDPKTNATRMFAYLNDGIIGTSGANQIRLRDWKIGDMAAISDTTFLVMEAALRGTSDFKRVYKININGATPVTSGLYSGKTLEALVDAAGLSANSIVPVKKTLFLDLLANGWPAVLDKAEGLAIINDSTIAIGNDNDYGQTTLNGAEDGVAVATTNLSHVFTYGLQGSNKLSNLRMGEKAMWAGPSTAYAPFVTPAAPGVKTTALLTAGESVNGYMMAGIPDGTGAFDNGDGTFTFLVNHEIPAGSGGIRAHGANGGFVSKWTIKKSDLTVTKGEDLIKRVHLWNKITKQYEKSTVSMSRFCSADLPAVSAFYNAATGKGTMNRIFMNGEEAGDEGRAFAHIVTGDSAGVTFELPYLGKFSWENAVASPTAADKTIVVGLDDSTPGQVTVYVGDKSNTGSDIEKAGLSGGKLYGVSVTGLVAETNASVPSPNTAFSLVDIGNIRDSSGAAINTKMNNLGVTTFLRPEDGAWDPKAPNDFYFLTTNSFSGNSRMWRLRFTNIVTPELGGTITAVLDGSEGQKMMDNLGIDKHGRILIVEDVGGNAHLGKTWAYNIEKDELKQVGSHDTTRFLTGSSRFLTIDEEATGIIDAEEILGEGMFLLADQAHFRVAGEQYEGGQLLTMFYPLSGTASSATPYVIPAAPEVRTTALLTAGDVIGGYKMAGIPDGTGAFDNGDGTFTFLVNHEIPAGSGGIRAHGANGGFVSKWTIKKSDLTVTKGEDLIKRVHLWNKITKQYEKATVSMSRFCSADLPAVSAFYNATTGKGTMNRIFMNGEESGDEGRAFAHIVNGDSAGVSFELPYLGKFSWENSVASPTSSDKTIVVGLDDSTPGQVYVYVGDKSNTGSDIEKAGLSGGKLYGVSVTGLVAETNASVPAAGTVFTLTDIGNIRDSSGTRINTISNNLGVTTFLRPEDGAWDPKAPNDFYFLTTNSFSGNSRMWRLRFTNIVTPELGGTITAVLEGNEGQKMMDNLGIDNYGHILIVEDVGGNAHLGKTWQYKIATDEMKLIASHDTTRFLTGASRFLTIDEEATGIIDAEEILGPGMFLLADQAHYRVAGEQYEGGQLLTLFNPDTYMAYQNTLGVEDNNLAEKASDVYVFPNPASKAASVYTSLAKTEQVTITVLDMKGNVVVPANIQTLPAGIQQTPINMENLENGIYIVQVSTSSKTTRVKTVVIR